MTELFYDLHVHSCLSPCGDENMTPANIAGMAALKGWNWWLLRIITAAVTALLFWQLPEHRGSWGSLEWS